ncbi:MAG: hypothetical protein WB949_03170, partial [Candidatus Acidiferrales bacterium]
LDEPSAMMPVYVVWRKNEQARTALDFVRYAKSAFEGDRSVAMRRALDRNSRKRKSSKHRFPK